MLNIILIVCLIFAVEMKSFADEAQVKDLKRPISCQDIEYSEKTSTSVKGKIESDKKLESKPDTDFEKNPSTNSLNHDNVSESNLYNGAKVLDDEQFQNYLISLFDNERKLESNIPNGFVDKVIVSKLKKKLFLIKNNTVLKSYSIALGGDPYGPKHFRGDYKTPEGLYYIDYKNEQSSYHLSLHISYPNKGDLEYANSIGLPAGSDIMIHGFPNNTEKRAAVKQVHPEDWTNGCIAVTDEEVEEIFTLVKENTPIEICPLKR